MNKNIENIAEWENCPVGVMQSVARVNKFSRRRLIFKVGALTAVIGSGVFAKQTIWPQPAAKPAAPRLRNICCNKVRKNLKRYSTNELCDKKLMASIKCHLKNCNSCREAYDYLLNCCDG